MFTPVLSAAIGALLFTFLPVLSFFVGLNLFNGGTAYQLPQIVGAWFILASFYYLVVATINVWGASKVPAALASRFQIKT